MRSRFELPTLLALAALFPPSATAYNLDCSNIKLEDAKWNLKSLEGPHSLYKIQKHFPTVFNTTFTLDICRPLKKSKGKKSEQECPNGTRVCAIRNATNVEEHNSIIDAAIPIAGELSLHGKGGNLDPKWTRLKTSASHSDSKKEGLRLEMHGGRFDNEDQAAIIEFLCPKSSGKARRTRDSVTAKEDGDDKNNDDGDNDEDDDGDEEEDHNGEEVDDGQEGTIKYVDWGIEGGAKVLRLQWTTKYACENAVNDSKGGSTSKHWGFFTWFIIIMFLGIAAYLVFGTWLNYNRLGTRGFDSVPHADTIRDLPYLFRDWIRKVMDSVQGGHSRAGYSAV